MQRMKKIICSCIAGLLTICSLLLLLGTVGAYELGNINFIWFCIGFAISIAMAGGSVLLQLWISKKEKALEERKLRLRHMKKIKHIKYNR